MAHAYDIDLAVRVYQRSFFKNAARPEVVLETDQRLTREEAGRILTRWNQKHQGLDRAFTPTILEGGLKVKPLSFPAKDFEFATLAGWTRDNILAAYGVPAGKLGLVEDVNRANAEGIEITFNSECIRPRLDLLEDVLQSFLAPAFGENLLLAHDNPIPADRAELHSQAMEELDRGVITINEFRAGKGMKPTPWGDEPRTYGHMPFGVNASGKSLKPTKVEMKHLRRELARTWPRLEARFAGWSSSRVVQELGERPALLDALVPPGLTPEKENALRRRLGECLKQGLSVERVIAELEPEPHKES